MILECKHVNKYYYIIGFQDEKFFEMIKSNLKSMKKNPQHI